MSNNASDVDVDSLIESLPACKRCRDCRRGCDTLLPACRQCTKAGAECIFFDHGLNEFLPRSYISSLVDHVRAVAARRSSAPALDVPNVSIATTSAQVAGPLNSDAYSFDNHFCIDTNGVYRYVGGASCLAASPMVYHASSSPHLVPDIDLRPTFGDLAPTPETHSHLVHTFFTTIHSFYPIVDPSARYLAPEIPPDLKPTETFALHMIYSISCHILSANNSHFTSFGDASFQHAMKYVEASTTDATIATLRHVLLLAMNSIFDPQNGNLGQEIALASRLAIDLEVQDLNSQDTAIVQNMHLAIFCIENEMATTLDRPATFSEPLWELSFDPTNKSQYLCSLYRLQHRYRRGDTSVLALMPHATAHLAQLSPGLKIALHQSHLLMNPTPTNAFHVLNSVADMESHYIYLTPHWVYRAATIILQNRATLDPNEVLQAYGNASFMLARAGRKFDSANALGESLKEILRQTGS